MNARRREHLERELAAARGGADAMRPRSFLASCEQYRAAPNTW